MGKRITTHIKGNAYCATHHIRKTGTKRNVKSRFGSTRIHLIEYACSQCALELVTKPRSKLPSNG